MMALALITSLVKNFNKIEKLEDRIEVAGNIPRAIETFEEYHEAYKTGYPYDAKNFTDLAKNQKDKETLEIWSLLSQDIEELKAKELIKPDKLEKLSIKSALEIVESAWLSLDQDAREALQEEDENEEQRQKR